MTRISLQVGPVGSPVSHVGGVVQGGEQRDELTFDLRLTQEPTKPVKTEISCYVWRVVSSVLPRPSIPFTYIQCLCATLDSRGPFPLWKESVIS